MFAFASTGRYYFSSSFKDLQEGVSFFEPPRLERPCGCGSLPRSA